MVPEGVIHTADHDRLEQMYSLEVATELVPFRTIAGLRTYLMNHKERFPARYRKMHHAAMRMLYECEVIAMREALIRDGETDRRRQSVLANVIARAQA